MTRRAERMQLRNFLEGSQFTFEKGADPPDGWACRDGKRCAALEHTEYWPDAAQHGSELAMGRALWPRLWEVLDEQRRRRPWLKNRSVHLEFRSGCVPGERQVQSTADRLMALLDQMPNLFRDRLQEIEKLRLLKRDDRKHLSYFPPFGHDCFTFEGEMDVYLNSGDCDEFSSVLMCHYPDDPAAGSWPEWSGSDMVAGGVGYDPATFRRLLTKKGEKTRQHTHAAYQGLPCWLVIECNQRGFAAPSIFPREGDTRCEEVVLSTFRDSLRDSQFDLKNLAALEQVWLVADGERRRFCLHPAEMAGWRTLRK